MKKKVRLSLIQLETMEKPEAAHVAGPKKQIVGGVVRPIHRVREY